MALTGAALRLVVAATLLVPVTQCRRVHLIAGLGNPDDRIYMHFAEATPSPEAAATKLSTVSFPQRQLMWAVEHDFSRANDLRMPGGTCTSLTGPMCLDLSPSFPSAGRGVGGVQWRVPAQLLPLKTDKDLSMVAHDAGLTFTTGDDPVVEVLDADTFEESVVPDREASFITVAHFYSPTCLHCVHASAAVRAAAIELLSDQVQVLAINCLHEKSRGLCHKFNVNHLPDTRLLRVQRLGSGGKFQAASAVYTPSVQFLQEKEPLEKIWKQAPLHGALDAWPGWTSESLVAFVKSHLSSRIIDLTNATSIAKREELNEAARRHPPLESCSLHYLHNLANPAKGNFGVPHASKHGAILKGGGRSVPSSIERGVTFMNWRSRRCRILWLDFKGNEVPYFEIEPKARKHSASFVNHVWLARDIVTNVIVSSWIVVDGKERQLLPIYPDD